MTTQLKGPHTIDDLSPPMSNDVQLTIRIPNPKVYMARKSQWVGQRGKPRCDHCRTSNLKCDRILPICNHCSWANQKQCKYTPLPTPAHKGIPRCDHCRELDIKCDRNLPICNNCQERIDGAACNYAPKIRHKPHAKEESSSKKNGEKILFRVIDISGPPLKLERGNRRHTRSGLSVGTSHSASPGFSRSDSESESWHTGRFTAKFARPEYISNGNTQCPSLGLGLTARSLSGNHKPPFINTSQSWFNPSCVPLPDFVCQRLRQLDPVEIPTRRDFDKALLVFQNGIMGGLRETVCFPVEKYNHLAKYLAGENTTKLSDRVRTWVGIHRLCIGSSKHNIILAPHDSIFFMDATSTEGYRRQFVTALLSGITDTEALEAYHYDRLPVQEQLYDILTYAHRSHLPAAQMLTEIVRLRYAFVTWPMAEMYVRMCPSCRQEQRHSDPNFPSQD